MKKIFFSLIFSFCGFMMFSDNFKITISAIGDIMTHDNLQAYALNSEKKYNVFFEHVKNVFLTDDLTIANLETPVNDILPVSGYPNFNAKTILIDAIKESGIEVVSLANNHSYDQGEKGVISTIEAVKSKGLLFSGTGLTPKESKTPIIFNVKGVKIGYIALTFSLNGSNIFESPNKAYVNLVPMENQTRINEFVQIISEAKKNVDIMIVSYHCGDEYKSNPIPIQEKVIKIFCEAGADVVLAHHPHVLEKVEYFETKDKRKTLIAYSLGNFISAQSRYIPKITADNKDILDSVLSKTAEGMILQFDIIKWEEKYYAASPRVIPLYNVWFRYKKNNRLYDGFHLNFVSKILNMDETADSNFIINTKDVKRLVAYRLEKIKKLVGVNVIE